MSRIYREEFQRRTQSTTMLSVALGMVTALQGVAMFFALRDLLGGTGAESIAIPIAAGIVIGVAFWVAWHWPCRVGPLAHNPVTRAMFVAVGALLTVVAISTTSWFVAAAIGGGQALQKHMQAHTLKMDGQLAVLTTNAAAEQELGDKLSMISTGWRVMSESEERGNVSSKGKGCGSDCETYKRASGNYAAQQASVEAVFAEFNAEKVKASDLRKKMDKVASNDASPAGQAKFSEMAAEFSQLVTRMDALTALPRVGAGIVEVESKGGVTSVKNDALTKELKDKVKSIKSARQPVPAAFYATMSKGTATLEYAADVPAAWLVGVAFDLLPFIMFVMMMLAYSEARAPYEPRRSFEVIEGDVVRGIG